MSVDHSQENGDYRVKKPDFAALVFWSFVLAALVFLLVMRLSGWLPSFLCYAISAFFVLGGLRLAVIVDQLQAKRRKGGHS